MAKRPTLKTITSGYASQAQLNSNFTNIQTAFDNTLSLDGSTPNAMGADLDLNGNDIINVDNLTVTGNFILDGATLVPSDLSSITNLEVSGTLTLGTAVTGLIDLTYPDGRIAISNQENADRGRPIEMRINSGSDDEALNSSILIRKKFQKTGDRSGPIGHNVQLQTIQEPYNEQNVWGLSHTHTQRSPRGSANAVSVTVVANRELYYDGTEYSLGTVDDPIDGQMWGIHAPLQDTIDYATYGIPSVSPIVNEWSIGCWNKDHPTNRQLNTVAEAQAGATKRPVHDLGYLGKRAMHTMTAYGWDQDAEVGAGIIIKTNSVGGGDGNRAYTDPDTGVSYLDAYGSYRYGIVISDLEGRASGNPGIVGVGMYIANGGQYNLELYGDPNRGLYIHGEYDNEAIRVAGTASKGINFSNGTFTNNRAISLGDNQRITLSNDDSKYLRWNSSNNRVEFVDGTTVRGYVDMATGTAVKMN